MKISPLIFKWTSLLLGCVIQLLWGSLGTTPIYINAFKVQYNLTQSTAEMLPAIIAVGRCFTPFASFIFQVYGPTGSFTLGLWMGAGGYFLLWSTAFFKSFYETYPGIMAIYFFFVGHGSMHTYLGVLTVVTWNFRGKHQGKAVSLVETCYGATPLAWLAIYRLWLSGKDVYEDSKQDFTGFLFIHGVISAVCTIAAILLIRPIDLDQIEDDPVENAGLTDTEKPVNDPDALDLGRREKEKSSETSNWRETLCYVLRPFSTWPFQLLLWVFCLTNTVSLGVEMNMSVYTKSVNMYPLVDAAVISYNVCLCVSRLTIGVLLDKFENRVPKMTYTALLSVTTAITFGVASFIPGEPGIVMAISIVTGVYCGVTKAVTAVLVAQKLDSSYFASYWGVFQTVQCTALLLWQRVLAGLYEAMIPADAQLECFGDDCFRWTLVIACLLSVLAVALSSVLAAVKRF